MKPKIIVICGPTCTGKTGVSILLNKIFDCEIISADSLQIYRDLDIGTAKPTCDELSCVIHHMINIKNPDEPFDAAQYASMAKELIFKITKKGKIPLIVGGTGLYIKALTHGLCPINPVDPSIRHRLKQEAKLLGIRTLYERLEKYNKNILKKIHPNDSYRIIRALEIYEAFGKSINNYHDEHGFKAENFDVLKIGLKVERDILYDKINKRVDIMIDQGFLNEVQGLIDKGYSPKLKPLCSIGYRQIIQYINGDLIWDEAIRIIKRDTRRYAKRQLTWFNKDSNIIWKEPQNIDEISELIRNFLI